MPTNAAILLARGVEHRIRIVGSADL